MMLRLLLIVSVATAFLYDPLQLPGVSEVMSNFKDTFICDDGSTINIDKVCDGQANCADLSDETHSLCHRRVCRQDKFRCFYGACVPFYARCNGQSECMDNSDESRCGHIMFNSCEINEFQCEKDGLCIPNEKLCDGVRDCTNGYDERELCANFSCPSNTYRCRRGGCIHASAKCNIFVDCPDGSDESQELCANTLRSLLDRNKTVTDKIGNLLGGTAQSHCAPIRAYAVHAACKHRGGAVPCDQPLPTDTVVSFRCHEHYEPISSMAQLHIPAVCQKDGTLTREILECKPECGKLPTQITPLIANGWSWTPAEWPWYVALYRLKDDKWSFACGSSLISDRMVITAAHCLWRAQTNQLRLAFGKYYSDIETVENGTRFSSVERIILPTEYQDKLGNFGTDIALLVLPERIPISQTIKPVCIDWNKDIDLRPGTNGNIVGMGLTENETFSRNLRMASIPIIDSQVCIASQKKDIRKYVTHATFCAGLLNGTGVCNGDSGGGLMFPNANTSRWYVQGLVSMSPRKLGTAFCDLNYYTIFTKVAIFNSWIQSEMLKLAPM